MEKVVIGFDRTLDGTGGCQSLEQTFGLILIIHNIFAQLKIDEKKLKLEKKMEFLFFTCSSSWIEAARGRPSATLAIMVIKIIFLDLWNFESDTKHQSASKSSISVYISRWEWHCTTIFKAQKISRKNGENATVLLYITGNNFNLTRKISKLFFAKISPKRHFYGKFRHCQGWRLT